MLEKQFDAVALAGGAALGAYQIGVMEYLDKTGALYNIKAVSGSSVGALNAVLYAMAQSFEAAMKKYGVRYDMIVGQGMYHCYPVYPLVKEAKDGWKQLIGILRRFCRGQ